MEYIKLYLAISFETINSILQHLTALYYQNGNTPIHTIGLRAEDKKALIMISKN